MGEGWCRGQTVCVARWVKVGVDGEGGLTQFSSGEKPVLNRVNVCSRAYLEVFGEPSWFLNGRTFLREPSWEYSSNCDEAIFGVQKSFAQHVLETFARFETINLLTMTATRITFANAVSDSVAERQ